MTAKWYRVQQSIDLLEGKLEEMQRRVNDLRCPIVIEVEHIMRNGIYQTGKYVTSERCTADLFPVHEHRVDVGDMGGRKIINMELPEPGQQRG